MYGIYINLGCRFEFRTQKLPYERISGNFFDFIDFGHQVRVCKKKIISQILAVIQNIWDLHKFGLQIWIQNAKITLWKNFGQFFRFHRFWSSGPGMQKLPYERISGNFSDFIDFGHQVRVCKKSSFHSISCISKYMGLT